MKAENILKGLEKNRLEYEALQEFVGLVDVGGNLGSRVKVAMTEELTHRQRELISLYYLEEISMTEIAHRLGISPSTISRTLKRGKTRLKKYLKYNGRYIAEDVSE